MKNTGIVRSVDELGRIVIPKEIRRVFEIEEKDALEIYTEGESIILKKHHRGCIFCSDCRDITEFKGKIICKACLKDIRRAE